MTTKEGPTEYRGGGIVQSVLRSEAMTLARQAELQVLAASAAIVFEKGMRQYETRQPTLAEVREGAPHLTDREFAAALQRLVASGVVTRTGRGKTATVRRNLSAWRR